MEDKLKELLEEREKAKQLLSNLDSNVGKLKVELVQSRGQGLFNAIRNEFASLFREGGLVYSAFEKLSI